MFFFRFILSIFTFAEFLCDEFLSTLPGFRHPVFCLASHCTSCNLCFHLFYPNKLCLASHCSSCNLFTFLLPYILCHVHTVTCLHLLYPNNSALLHTVPPVTCLHIYFLTNSAMFTLKLVYISSTLTNSALLHTVSPVTCLHLYFLTNFAMFTL
jgi:hypothetical protein